MVDSFKAVKKIIQNPNKDRPFSLAADILRVLVVDHGVCWRSELEEDLQKLHRFLGQHSTLKKKEVDSALKVLIDNGLLDVEYRKRGDWPGVDVYVDQLIKIIDLDNARRGLEHDQSFLKFTSARQRVYDSLR